MQPSPALPRTPEKNAETLALGEVWTNFDGFMGDYVNWADLVHHMNALGAFEPQLLTYYSVEKTELPQA